MQIPLPYSRGLFIPPEVPKINFNHRLASQLRYLWIASIPKIELTTGKLVANYNSGALSPGRLTRNGQSLLFTNGAYTTDGVDFGYALLTSDGGAGFGDFTLACVANPASSGATQALVGNNNTASTGVRTNLNANTDNAGNASAGSMAFVMFDGTTVVSAAGAGMVDGNMHAWMGTRVGSAATLYRDGFSIGTASHAPIQVNGNTPVISLGGIPGLSLGANCNLLFAAEWTRGLSQGEAIEWGLNPTCFLLFPSDFVFATLVSAPAAPPPPAVPRVRYVMHGIAT